MSGQARMLVEDDDEERAISDAGDEIRDRLRTGGVLRRVPHAVPGITRYEVRSALAMPEQVSEIVVESLIARGFVLPWPLDRSYKVVEFRPVHAQFVPKVWVR